MFTFPTTSILTTSGINFHSVDLNGDYAIVCADEAAIRVTGSISIELSVKFDAIPGSGVNTMLCTKKISGQTHSFLFFVQGNTGGTTLDVIMQVANNSSFAAAAIITPWTPTIGVWHHLAATWDPTLSGIVAETEIYIDTVSQSLFATTDGDLSVMSDNFYDLRWGGYNNGSYLDGHVAEMRLWSNIRSAAQISGSYNTHIDAGSSGLECYIQNDGTTIVDASNNALSITAAGLTASTDVPF